ncbi:MAG: Gfo/Idh/MocA family oxidoreductase [Phycisphaerae bacterium]|nr:Gfo/Idh/MocA family oxidoreductase [Phycisphaerae bacterium]
MTQYTRRRFIEHSLLATAAIAGPVAPTLARLPRRRSANEVIRVGVIGVRGRGRAHIGAFKQSPDSEVVAICDPDEGVIGPSMEAVPGASYHRDLRRMLEDPSIDAVSIATPNHWHSLATIWALQAGKHVYVEKPISHNVREGRIVVDAARRYGKVVQHGTQSRSHVATREAMQWLHAGGLGKIHLVHALCYKRRQSIGAVTAPQTPPVTLDYDLWTGPATLEPLRRTNLHYDWHWVFNTGNGDIGNQGVHQMDIARWGLGRTELPKRVMSCGGRFGYVDDGETPNSQIAVYDYGDQQLIFEVRGLKTPAFHGANIGVIFHGEHGKLVSSSYSKVVVFDHDGALVREFKGGGNHVQDFLDAVRAGTPASVSASPLDGHLSTALCHLGNISYRLGTPRALAAAMGDGFRGDAAARDSIERLQSHLRENGVALDTTDGSFGPWLDFDPATERFTGFRADEANTLLTRRSREPFVVPERV